MQLATCNFIKHLKVNLPIQRHTPLPQLARLLHGLLGPIVPSQPHKQCTCQIFHPNENAACHLHTAGKPLCLFNPSRRASNLANRPATLTVICVTDVPVLSWGGDLRESTPAFSPYSFWRWLFSDLFLAAFWEYWSMILWFKSHFFSL